MKKIDDVMKAVSPKAVLKEISQVIPKECIENMIIIGSLAVGFYYFKDKEEMVVRTKDADCLLSPRIKAINTGINVTEQLFKANWKFRSDEKWLKPGDENTLTDKLPAVRLHPPYNTDWFIELLTVPESSQDREKKWIRLETIYGHFGLCSFGFLSLVNYEPLSTELGIFIARPEMMALANMLEHPIIGIETMSGLIHGRAIKRSNKDLGRVLAIAYLSAKKNEDAMLQWPGI